MLATQGDEEHASRDEAPPTAATNVVEAPASTEVPSVPEEEAAPAPPTSTASDEDEASAPDADEAAPERTTRRPRRAARAGGEPDTSSIEPTIRRDLDF